MPRRRTEHGERLTASLFRLLDRSTDLIAVFAPDLRHIYCNDAVCRMMQMSREEIIGRRYDQMPMSRGNVELMQASIREVFATGEPRRLEVRGRQRATGGTSVFDISYYPEPGEDGRPAFVIGVSRDVSDLRFAEERARAAAERLSILLDSVDAAILGIGRTLTIDFANHLACDYLRELGPPSEAPGGHTQGIIGTALHLLLTPRDAPGVLAHIVAVLESGEPQAFEREVELNGASHRFAIQILPERDKDGGVRGAVVVARDVTLERQRDAQLRLSERMVSLARIAAGVAHEIANPLSAVYGNLELVRLSLGQIRGERPELADPLRELEDMLGDAHQGAERIRQIIEEIGLLVRADTAGLNRVDLRELVDHVLRELRDRLRPEAQVRVQAEPVPDVAGSRSQLAQVVTNLLENAILAMPPGRPTSANRIDITLVRERDEVVLRIRDNGVGLSAEDLPHVFDPFFTTRSVNEGMGLGLTIAHGIVTSHHGTLSFESTLHQGSTVTMRLPISHD